MDSEKLQGVTRVTYVIAMVLVSCLYFGYIILLIMDGQGIHLSISNRYISSTILYLAFLAAATIRKYVLLTFAEIAQNLKK